MTTSVLLAYALLLVASVSQQVLGGWNTSATFVGYATFRAWTLIQTANYTDKLMDAACGSQFPGTTAAFQEQVLSQLVSGLPPANTAGYAVLLKCSPCTIGHDDDPNSCHAGRDCFGQVQKNTIDGYARRCVLPLPPGGDPAADVPSRKWPIHYYNLFDNCYANTTRAAMCVAVHQIISVLPVVSNQCQGNCMKKVGYCFCDNVCTTNGDCCPGFSFQMQCGAPPPVVPTVVVNPECEGKCGAKVGFCYCDSECDLHGDCCFGFSYQLQCPGTPAVNMSSVLLPLAPLAVNNLLPWENRVLPTSVCEGHCGDRVGYCFCDQSCEIHGDCCPFFSFDILCASSETPSPTAAGPDQSVISNSCAGYCGGFTGVCWCDGECETSDDCCTDVNTFCALLP